MSLSTSKPDLSSKRRRFQTPITTFFPTSAHPSSDGPSSVSHNHYSALTHSPTPVVPAKVQASLLSVGMRVRKSVAEGYKTHHAKGIDEKHISTTTFTKEERRNTSVNPGTYSASTRSELTPFSGMGRMTQYQCTPSLPYLGTSTQQQEHTITTEDDAFSLPPSSQESIDSQSYSTPPPPILKKRTHTDFDFEPYEDEEEIDLDLDEVDNKWQDPPRLNPFHNARAGAGTNLLGRTILSPTLNQQRRRFLGAKHKPAEGNPMDLDDFEEPAFLRRREEVDMDVVAEVQMGGV
ncbi:ribonucleotide reductase inhibitor-domain-containing protein [Aspergillus pseudoustus]|uniref:Ribonucleotide reductase inhibitor-domain-containing protein n=1 Tax=Aspergillus pseudoustus TaxID=1810923 RepID=A0ABR4J0G3_9EURO